MVKLRGVGSNDGLTSSDGSGLADLISSSCGVGFEDSPDLIANLTEAFQAVGFRSGRARGIEKSPVMAVNLAWKHRTGLIGIATDGDDGFDRSLKEFAQRLGSMMRDIDSDFGHDLNCERVHMPRGF